MTLADTVCEVLDCEKMKRIRLKRGLSMSQAASAAGLRGRQGWYRIESGRQANITLDTLNRIAHALGVQPRDLLK